MKSALKLLGIVAVALGVGLAMMPWTLRGAVRQGEISAHIARISGLDLKVRGPFLLKLLPRPRVQMADVSIANPGRTLQIDAPALYGDLDIGALLQGRWRLASTTLSDPTITLELDKNPLETLVSGTEASETEKVASPAFRLSIRSGVVRLRSRNPEFDTLLTEVNLTAAQAPSADGSLTVSGAALWRTAQGQFTARVARPRTLLKGGSSPAFLQVTSPIASFSAAGDLTGGQQRQFAGHVSIACAALPRLLKTVNAAPGWLTVQKASLSGDVLAKLGDVSLSSSLLRLDASAFEGTLGFHTDGGHSLLEGTLASDDLDLTGLFGQGLDARGTAAWLEKSIDPNLLATNLDLRVSAGVARLGKTEFKDAALSAFSHDGRMEVTLDEAGLFDGLLKARGVAALGPRGVEAHAELSLSNVDLGPLSTSLVGQERLTGTLGGKLTMDGHGAGLGDIVRTLSGEGQVSVDHGTFTGVSVTQALKRLTRHLPLSGDPSGQVTRFESAASAIRIEDGIAKLVDGNVTGPGMQLTFGGHTDLPRGRIDVLAVAASTDASGLPISDAPRLPLEMRGSWDEPMSLVQHTRAFSLPALPIPLLEPGQALP